MDNRSQNYFDVKIFNRTFITMIIMLILIGLSTEVLTEDKKNFLFIVVDDLRPALGCYGDANAHTPNIDKLAESSYVFGKAYAQQALCAPSRNSFLTGRRPDTLRLYDFRSYWRDTVGNFTTLPEHLKNNGYDTKSVGKIFHPGTSCNRSDDSPYSWTKRPFHPSTDRYKNSPVCGNQRNSSLHKNLICPVDVNEMPGGTLPDFESLDAAKKFIENRRNKERPFFLAVGFQKPHIPLKYPREYLKYHPLSKFNIVEPYRWPDNVSTVAYNPWTDLRKRHDVKKLNLNFPWEKIPVNFGKKIVQSYYAAISYVDDLIGILLRQLKASGFDDNTIVVLTSDHGWSLGEHSEWAKYSNFEVALRVPLLISIPRNEPRVQVTNVGTNGFRYPFVKNMKNRNVEIESMSFGRKSRIVENNRKKDDSLSDNFIDEIVELVDLFPTVAELAGHPIQICPDDRIIVDDNYRRNVRDSSWKTCSEGISLMPLIRASVKDKSLPWKKGVFSQYPRPGLEPKSRPNSDEPRFSEITIMGYSLRTRRHRYTAWIKFSNSTKIPDWNSIVAEEFYDHYDDPQENFNLADDSRSMNDKEQSMRILQRGWREALP